MSKVDQDFELKKAENIDAMKSSDEFKEVSRQWMEASGKFNYTYNFSWFGVPIIQFPTDILMMQELIWSVRPDFVVETGVARGGSICLYSSLLALLDLSDAQRHNSEESTSGLKERRVIGIDIDIRPHTLAAINSFDFKANIDLIEGSSTSMETIKQVSGRVGADDKCIVVLDSNHTHEHVLKEIELYSEIIGSGSLIVVFDTSIEFDGEEKWSGVRDWGPGNSPLSALREFLSCHPEFSTVDGYWEKLGITVCPFGIIRKH